MPSESIFFLLAFIAFYFYGLGHLPLVGPDEPRYAQVAREMFLRGDWITPTLGGHTWFEKPALLYWMEIAAFRVFGVHDWPARLGPALCGVLTVVAIWLLTRKAESWTENEQTSRGNVTALCCCFLFGNGGVLSRCQLRYCHHHDDHVGAQLFSSLRTCRRSKKTDFDARGLLFLCGTFSLAKGLVGIVIPEESLGFITYSDASGRNAASG